MNFIIGMVSALFVMSAQAADQSDHFIQAFSQSCEGWGVYTRDAVNLSRAYADVLKKIKDDPNCSQVTSALDSVHNIAEGLDDLNMDTRDKFYREARSNAFMQQVFSSMYLKSILNPGNNGAQTFFSAFPIANFGDITNSLGLAFASSKGIEVSRLQEQIAKNEQNNLMVGDYFGKIFPAISNSQACFIAHPNVPSALISHALTLMGASMGGSFIGAEIGGAMRAVGALLNSLTEFARVAPLDRALRENQRMPMYAALSCGLEAMVNNYCRAEDATVLFDTEAAQLAGSFKPEKSAIWEGLQLMVRRYPPLREWMKRLELGASSQSEERAQRNARIRARFEKSRTIGDFIAASYIERKDDIDRISDADEGMKRYQRISIVQRFVKDLARKTFEDARAGADENSNPYVTFFPHNSECLFQRNIYLGLGNVVPSTIACEILLEQDAALADDLERIKRNVDLVQSKIEAIVQAEKSWYLGPLSDPENLWMEGTRLSNGGTTSNYTTIVEVLRYLKRLQDRWNVAASSDPKQFGYLAKEAQRAQLFESILGRVADLMNAPQGKGPDGKEMSTESKISEAAKLLKLEAYFDYFIENMIAFIDADISERMRNNELDQNVSELLKIASSDFIRKMIRRTGGVVDTLSVNEDLDNARNITRGAIRSYTSYLGPQIVSAIKHWRTMNAPKIRAEGIEGVRMAMPDPIYASPAAPKLCLLALAADDDIIDRKMYDDPLWGKLNGFATSLKEACSGLSFYSTMHAATKLEVKFSETEKQPWRKRICELYGLRKKTRIYELHSILQTEKQERHFE